jgi:hypothetical protein
LDAEALSDSDYIALTRLVNEMFWCIDHENDRIPDFYTDDAVLVEGPPLDEVWEGREKVVAWAKARPQWAQHVISNIRFAADGPERAVGNCTLTAFVDDPELGHKGSSIPGAVVNIDFRAVRTPEGWRFNYAKGNWRFTRPGRFD